MTLVHEKEYKALSNMPVERVVTRPEDGFVESHFEESLQMSTYLLAFIVCDFAYKESRTKSGKKVCVLCYLLACLVRAVLHYNLGNCRRRSHWKRRKLPLATL